MPSMDWDDYLRHEAVIYGRLAQKPIMSSEDKNYLTWQPSARTLRIALRTV
jgi:hypothetical protein